MTRTIIRSDISETDTKPPSLHMVPDYQNIGAVYIHSFIDIFYEYRNVLTYDSRLFIIYAKCYKDSTGNTIKLEDIETVPDDFIVKSILYDHHPIAVVLSVKFNEIIPLSLSILHEIKELHLTPKTISLSDIGGRIHSFTKSELNHNFHIRTINIGYMLFNIDYNYEPASNTVNFKVGDKTETSKQMPISRLDFISANKPSLYHFNIESDRYYVYKLPHLVKDICLNLKEILSELCPPFVIKLTEEDEEVHLFTYISKQTLDRDAKLKRKAELEAELQQLENELK